MHVRQIPVGEVAAVQGTPFDFTAAKELGAAIPNIDGGGKPGVGRHLSNIDTIVICRSCAGLHTQNFCYAT